MKNRQSTAENCAPAASYDRAIADMRSALLTYRLKEVAAAIDTYDMNVEKMARNDLSPDTMILLRYEP